MARVSKLKGVLVAAGLVGLGSLMSGSTAHAGLIESWENPAGAMDGWTSPQAWVGVGDTTTGVTDGAQSLNMTGANSPTYGQMLQSPASQPLQFELGQSTQILWDLTMPAYSGVAGGYQYEQWDVCVSSADPNIGFQSVDGGGYPASPSISSSTTTTTLSVTYSTGLEHLIRNSAFPIELIFQVGGGSGNGGNPPLQFWIDNIRTNTTDAPLPNFNVPEPTSLSLLGLAGMSLLGRRRKQA